MKQMSVNSQVILRVLAIALFLCFLATVFSDIVFPLEFWTKDYGTFHEIKNWISSYFPAIAIAQIFTLFAGIYFTWTNPVRGAIAFVFYFSIFPLINSLNGPFWVTPLASLFDDLFALFGGILIGYVLMSRQRSQDEA